MTIIFCTKNSTLANSFQKAHFVIEPLNTGYGLTLANALRRCLLANRMSIKPLRIRIKPIAHEFSLLPGVREDVYSILLNIKEIRFKHNQLLALESLNGKKEITCFISQKGPTIITAGLLLFPYNAIKIINPSLYICTITDKRRLYCELDIGTMQSQNIKENNHSISVESNFCPVVNVNFLIKLVHDSFGNVKESLELIVETDGSLSPKEAVYESIKQLLYLLLPLISTTSLKAFYDNIFNRFYMKGSF